MFDPDDSFERDAWCLSSASLVEPTMRQWDESVLREEPWCSMPLDDRRGALRRVLDELLDPSSSLESFARRRRIRTAAAHHGAFRGVQRCNAAVIISEFAVLRVALRATSRSMGTSRSDARNAMRWLRPDWTYACYAALDAHADARGVI